MKKTKKHPFCKSRIKWRLNHAASVLELSAVLKLVNLEVEEQTMAGWTPLQRAQAEEWACQVHLSASDNAFVRIPPKPKFLPKDQGMERVFSLMNKG